MTVGTKTLLVGVHAFWLHPVFVVMAWRELYGRWPLDWRLLVSIVLHDIGYWGCTSIDGAEGKWHPLLGAAAVSKLCDRKALRRFKVTTSRLPEVQQRILGREVSLGPYGAACLLHSRSMARMLLRRNVSPLCGADKLSLALYPRALYLWLASMSGELEEYLFHAHSPEGRAAGIDSSSPEAWFDSVSAYLRRVAIACATGQPAGVPPGHARSESC